jgi:hypothetical protein
MRITQSRIPFSWLTIALCATMLIPPAAQADQTNTAEFRVHFFRLCDLECAALKAGPGKDPFFIDSYAVRALCVAYDMTGKQEYLEACQVWSDQMIGFQDRMVPRGAYYMNYGRKPGLATNGWYVADSSSIGMGLLATAIRCKGAEKQRYLNSAKAFAALVMDNYVGPSGGIRNGLWPKFDGEWWCSSGIFASLAFLLYDETGEERYLKVALGVVDWLNRIELAEAKPYPLTEMGPTLPMYVLEGYSAGLPHLKAGSERRKQALTRITSALDWIDQQQRQAPRERQWPANVKWGMKFGGLPFHQYVYSRVLPVGPKLAASADGEMKRLEPLVFADKVELTQLPVFMMMSYAERLSPGTIYRHSGRGHRAASSPREWEAAGVN